MKRTEASISSGRFLPLAALAIIAIFIFLSAYQLQRWDTDIFWALKSGEHIVANFDVPRTDPFSQTFGDKAWIDFTWGFQVVAHYFYTYLDAWTGLFVLQLILSFLAMAVIYLNLKLVTGRRKWLPLALLFLVYSCVQTRLFIRPHLFGYLFIPLYFYLLSLSESGERKRWFYLLPLLQILWVNVHSSFILGVGITGAWALGAVIDNWRSGGVKAAVSRKVLPLLIVSALVCATSFINPYGWKLAVFPLIHMGGENADALRYIAEWTPVNLKELLFYIYPLPMPYTAIRILFYGLIAAFILNRRRIKSRDLILIAAVLYMAASHVRWLVVFTIFAAPILGSNIAAYLGRPEAGERTLSGARVLERVSIIIIIIFTVALAYDAVFVKGRGSYGVGLKAGHFPEATVAFMDEKEVRGNVYNEYVHGGYIVYHYPHGKVFIDGRTPTVYTPHFFWTSRVAMREGRWQRLVEEHSITSALVKHNNDFCNTIFNDPDWTPVILDDVAVLFLREAPINRALIEEYGMGSVKPCVGSRKYELPGEVETLELMRKELIGLKSAFKGLPLAARPHRLLGLVDTKLGGERLTEAVTELKMAIAISQSQVLYYDLGLALLKLKKFDEATAAFERALELDRTFSIASYGIGLSYYSSKRYVDAALVLKDYIELRGDKSEYKAYGVLGRACFNIGDYGCAIKNLKKAAFLTDENSLRADIYYKLGNSFTEIGNATEAALYYKKALGIEPEYEVVLRTLAEKLEKLGNSERAEAIAGIIDDKD